MRTRSKLTILTVLVLLTAPAYAMAQTFVPNEATAIAIAEAVSLPQLGDKLLDQVRPFAAKRVGENWMVVSQPKLAPGVFSTGGAVVVLIDSETGAIIDWSTVH